MVLQDLIFNSFYFGRVGRVWWYLKELIFHTVSTLGGCGGP